ncbi:MAG: hypothetical protein NTZ78_10310 [Candidatus Aureabacteria bacterium]|nr:hypothetical protein [Candidatus Auribacterota bacterium]
MNSKIRKTLRVTCGWILLVVGFIGLFLPILQGTLMMLAGASLLGWDLKPLRMFLRRFLARIKKMFRRS